MGQLPDVRAAGLIPATRERAYAREGRFYVQNQGGVPPPGYGPSPQQQPSVQPRIPDANYRYHNLALAANSYRFVGTLLKVVGVIFLLAGPLLLWVGMNTKAIVGTCIRETRAYLPDCQSSELAGGLNQTAFGWVWPVAVIAVTLWIGVPLVIRGFIQSAHGEALLAVADIAVATTSTGDQASLAVWSRHRSLSNFSAWLALGIVLIFILVGAAIVTSAIIAGDTSRSSDTLGAHRHRVDLDASVPVGFVAGAAVQFTVGSDDADWSEIDGPRLAFHSGESATVETVTGNTFTTKEYPSLVAPISAARLLAGADAATGGAAHDASTSPRRPAVAIPSVPNNTGPRTTPCVKVGEACTYSSSCCGDALCDGTQCVDMGLPQ
jgi:hypothetical protein